MKSFRSLTIFYARRPWLILFQVCGVALENRPSPISVLGLAVQCIVRSERKLWISELQFVSCICSSDLTAEGKKRKAALSCACAPSGRSDPSCCAGPRVPPGTVGTPPLGSPALTTLSAVFTYTTVNQSHNSCVTWKVGSEPLTQVTTRSIGWLQSQRCEAVGCSSCPAVTSSCESWQHSQTRTSRVAAQATSTTSPSCRTLRPSLATLPAQLPNINQPTNQVSSRLANQDLIFGCSTWPSSTWCGCRLG